MVAFAARPQSPHQPPVQVGDTELTSFFATLGWEGGRVEIVAGTNNPSNPDKIDLITYKPEIGQSTTRVWAEPSSLVDLEKHVRRLAARWGNVYISIGTYDAVPNSRNPERLTYNRSAPRKRRGFALDDIANPAALRLPPTWANETSPGNYQVGYTCEELLSPAEAETIGVGAALLEDADLSGADVEQLIRVPNSLNTKAKCAGRPGNPTTGQEPEGWRVRLRIADGPRYSRAQLATAFLPGGLAELARSATTRAETNERRRVEINSEAWQGLPDGAALMGTTRYQKLFAARPQLTKLATGERVVLPTKQGLKDTGSEQVAVLICNLVRAGRKGDDGTIVPGLGAPPEAEIRALAMHWHEALRPDCPRAAYQADVDRLIATYRPEGYAPETTKGSAGARTAPPPTPAPAQHRGRPAGQRAAQAAALLELIAALPTDEAGVRRTCRADLARALGATERMITAYLADLRTHDLLETRTEARALAVLRVEIKSLCEGGNRSKLDRVPTPETAPAATGVYTPPPLLLLSVPPVPSAPRAAPLAAPPAPTGGCVPPTAPPEPLPAPKPEAIALDDSASFNPGPLGDNRWGALLTTGAPPLDGPTDSAAWEAWEWADAPHGVDELDGDGAVSPLSPALERSTADAQAYAHKLPPGAFDLDAWLQLCRKAPLPPLRPRDQPAAPELPTARAETPEQWAQRIRRKASRYDGALPSVEYVKRMARIAAAFAPCPPLTPPIPVQAPLRSPEAQELYDVLEAATRPEVVPQYTGGDSIGLGPPDLVTPPAPIVAQIVSLRRASTPSLGSRLVDDLHNGDRLRAMLAVAAD